MAPSLGIDTGHRGSLAFSFDCRLVGLQAACPWLAALGPAQRTACTPMSSEVAADALAQVLRSADASAEVPDRVTFTGRDPVLSTRFLLGAAGAAAIAAVGVAISEFWTRRGGRPQKIAVDLVAAGASLRSNTYVRVDGAAPPSPWDPLSGFYPTADRRHIQLHTNFPHHRDGVLRVLGVAPTQEAVAAAIAQRKALELEDALAEAGLCAAVVRSPREWERHPQGRAVAALPLLEIVKVGDSDPEPLPKAQRPLAGVRCLDLTRVIAGPVCTRTLAEHGAEVLSIAASRLPNLPALQFDTGHGKRAADLDLERAGDVSRLRALAATADVFAQAYRPGALARRGFGPEELAALRPGIVCLSLSAYGNAGPWRERRGYDTLVQSASGIVTEHSRPGRRRAPRHLPCSALDYITGYLAAFGIVTALNWRALDGGSYHVRVSLAQTARFLQQMPRLRAVRRPDGIEPDASGLLADVDCGGGRVTYLRPVLQLSATPPHYAGGPATLGADPPVWREDLVREGAAGEAAAGVDAGRGQDVPDPGVREDSAAGRAGGAVVHADAIDAAGAGGAPGMPGGDAQVGTAGDSTTGNAAADDTIGAAAPGSARR